MLHGLVLNPSLVAASIAVAAVLVSALMVNQVTHNTRVLYQEQQAGFAQLQNLQNERSQLNLEVGALSAHARLSEWAREQGMVSPASLEVVTP